MKLKSAQAPSEILPRSFWVQWLENLALSSAADLVRGDRGRAGLVDSVKEIFSKNPIQEWEAERWMRGLKYRLLKTESYFFRAGTQKRSALSLFVRNERGLNVGLRREAITQVATYVTLITDYGYRREETQFESRHMDVVVRADRRSTWIYAENKARSPVLDALCDRLVSQFRDGVPYVDEESEQRVDDALNKANHIVRNRPRYFWGVAPGHRRAFEVSYTAGGFELNSIHDVPNADEMRRAPAAFSF